MLEARDLECARGDRPLFHGLGFTLRAGELLHVKGANGSGKTTLLRTLCGLTRPVSGEILWNGTPIRRLGDDYRAQLAYVGHLNGIQGELSCAENLRAVACLGGGTATPVADTLARVQLGAYARLPAKNLSQGQKRRLALARLAVLRRPLWILDEPLSALDTRSVALMQSMLLAQLDGDGMVIITSHQDLGLTVHRTVPISLDA